MSKLSAGLAIVGLLTPMGTQALGVGDIKLQSYLNQTLRAEIPLVLSQEKLGDIKITLAPPKDFEAAGLERTAVLSKLRFEVQPNASGQFSIRVRSNEIIREPFLSFLMEVTWPQGRIVRSFTVLLDPPDVTAAQTFPGVAAEAASASAQPGPMQARPIVAPSIGESNSDAGEYGPVGRNEKLWAIAEKINRDSSITTEQMVIALFRFNPQAFSKPSVNALNAGSILRIPTRDYILSISPSLAREEFYRHQTGRSLRWHKQPPRTARPAPQMEPAASPLAGSPSSSAPPVRSAPYVRSDAGMQAMEALRRENEEMRDRLAELEKRVAELQTLFMEREAAAPNEQPAGISARNPDTTADLRPEGSLEAQAPAPADGNRPASASVPGTPHAATTTSTPRQTAGTDAEALAPTVAGTLRTPDADSSPAPRTAGTASAPMPAAISDGPSHIVWWLLAGAAAAMSGLAFLHVNRIRKSRRHSGPAHPMEAQPLSAASHPSGSSTSTEAIRESPAESGRADSEEVDPIFEADIYISYGKFDQARETVEHAIRRYPAREAYRLKLLEIYAAQGDRRSFDDAVRDLEDGANSTTGPFGDRVRELARRFLPDPASLQPQAVQKGGGPQAPPKEQSGDDTDRLIDDLQRFSLEARNRSNQPSSENAPLGNTDAAEQTQRKVPDPTAHEIPWAPADAGRQPVPPEASAHETEASPIDRDRLIPFAPASISRTSHPRTDEESASQSIETLLKELTAIHYERHLRADAAGAVPAAPADDQSSGNLARTASPKTSGTSGNVAEAPNTAASGEEGISGAGEVETKLDLARAYADMGDHAQAKDFLREVLEQGSVQQQAEAAELLATLSST